MNECNRTPMSLICRGIAMFLITFSYTTFSYAHGLSSIKYIGIVYFFAIMLANEIRFAVPEDTFRICFALVFFFGLCSLMRESKINSTILEMSYAVYVGLVYCHADKVVGCKGDIAAFGMGAFTAILAALLTGENSLTAIGTGRKRVYGGFAHPNTFGSAAMACCMCFLILIYLTIADHKSDKSKKFLKLKLFAMCIAVGVNYCFCILSDSRGAIYTVLIFFAFLMFVVIYQKINLPTWSFTALLSLTTVLGAYLGINGVINGNSLISQDTLDGRIGTAVEIQFDSILEALIGDGLAEGSDKLVSGTEFSLSALLIKTGYIGTVIYIIIFLMMFRRGLYRSQRTKMLFEIMFITFMISCIAESYITNLTNSYAVVMWVLLSAFSNKDFNNRDLLNEVELDD